MCPGREIEDMEERERERESEEKGRGKGIWYVHRKHTVAPTLCSENHTAVRSLLAAEAS